MKYLYTLLFFVILHQASAQDMIYAPTGEKTPAKVVSITSDKIKYKNPANLTGPDYSKSLSKVLIAFNAAGNYLVFNDKNTPTDDEKAAFIAAAPAPKTADMLLDLKGGTTSLKITSEKGVVIAGLYKGKPVKIQRSILAVLIRKDGTHQLFISPDKAADLLIGAKAKLNPVPAVAKAPATTTPPPVALPIVNNTPVVTAPVTTPPIGKSTAVTTPANTTAVVTSSTTPATPPATTTQSSDAELNVDLKAFSKKAEVKIGEFSQYVNAICQANTERELAKKSIDLACDLFVSEDAKVEVSSVNSDVKPTYKIRAYLQRLQLRSKQYDNVKVQYANVNYASKFVKGADGNYYATITFVQKFQGFIDGKVVYGDKTKRNIQVVLKHYAKSMNGETKSGWDVYFDDMGVVETKKA